MDKQFYVWGLPGEATPLAVRFDAEHNAIEEARTRILLDLKNGKKTTSRGIYQLVAIVEPDILVKVVRVGEDS